MAEKTKKDAAKKPKNNIQFVGKQRKYNPDKGKYEDVLRNAPEFVMDGGEKIILPAGIEKGVYMENTPRLMAIFPNDFKTPVAKGE